MDLLVTGIVMLEPLREILDDFLYIQIFYICSVKV